ncbi:MAG: DUF1934 domain-containing protein [Ruminococcus sp.]|nr:DUF1934 domain-containing protein [Ruminococcus sp.]
MAFADKMYKNAKMQIETNTNGDITTHDGECLVKQVTGGTELFYKPADGASCTIMFGTKRSQINMRGEVSYKLCIEPGAKIPAVIKTSEGSFDVTVLGGDMLVKPFAGGFEAVLQYRLLAAGSVLSEVTVAARVRY